MASTNTYVAYDKDDFPIFCTGDAKEMANFLGLTIGSFYCTVSRYKKGKNQGSKFKVFVFDNSTLDGLDI